MAKKTNPPQLGTHTHTHTHKYSKQIWLHYLCGQQVGKWHPIISVHPILDILIIH